MGVVHDDGTHADQAEVIHAAAVEYDRVPDRHAISDRRESLFEGSVNDRAVLDVGLIADGDRTYVAAKNGVEPHRTVAAERNLTDQV